MQFAFVFKTFHVNLQLTTAQLGISWSISELRFAQRFLAEGIWQRIENVDVENGQAAVRVLSFQKLIDKSQPFCAHFPITFEAAF